MFLVTSCAAYFPLCTKSCVNKDKKNYGRKNPLTNDAVAPLFRSKIAMSASSWLDDYFSWLGPSGQDSCCRMKYMENETCFQSTVKPPGGNSTTPAPKVICYNKTLPVSPPVFCNATG